MNATTHHQFLDHSAEDDSFALITHFLTAVSSHQQSHFQPASNPTQRNETPSLGIAIQETNLFSSLREELKEGEFHS